MYTHTHGHTHNHTHSKYNSGIYYMHGCFQCYDKRGSLLPHAAGALHGRKATWYGSSVLRPTLSIHLGNIVNTF